MLFLKILDHGECLVVHSPEVFKRKVDITTVAGLNNQDNWF